MKGIGVERIDHVQIYVPRAVEEAAKRFYVEVIGLDEVYKPTQKTRGGAWYRRGDFTVHLSVSDVTADENRASERHVCYVVEDLAVAERVVRESGCPVLPDERPQPGLLRFYTEDPGGNRIEVQAKR